MLTLGTGRARGAATPRNQHIKTTPFLTACLTHCTKIHCSPPPPPSQRIHFARTEWLSHIWVGIKTKHTFINHLNDRFFLSYYYFYRWLQFRRGVVAALSKHRTQHSGDRRATAYLDIVKRQVGWSHRTRSVGIGIHAQTSSRASLTGWRCALAPAEDFPWELWPFIILYIK